MGVSVARCRLAIILKEWLISTHFDVIIIGGGPSGSSAAIGLAAGGMNVAIVEKKTFPREVLCGEFLSHEVTRAIREFGLYDEFLSLRPNRIKTFRFVPQNGVPIVQPLGFEAWSLKRSLLDEMLLEKAKSCGATIIQPAEVISIERLERGYGIRCSTPQVQRSFSADIVAAAYGKQNSLDKSLKRSFVSSRSGLSGLKYHLPRRVFKQFPNDEIQLFAAGGIYCGINRVNEEEATLCFLAKTRGHPKETLLLLLQKNKPFGAVFQDDLSSELHELPPHGTGNIFFGKKEVVKNGVFMIGDAAAVIAPLAGDGIGMAIESGQLLAQVLTKARRDGLKRQESEKLYVDGWGRLFRHRLRVASYIQGIALTSFWGNLGARMVETIPSLSRGMIQWTRS